MIFIVCLVKKDFIEFPLDEAVASIEWYEDFFQTKYPLPRYQLLGVPEFHAGAMENYGLVIGRESCIMAKIGINSADSLQWVASTVWHETAHQWAGNSVSPKWWDSLWLNEGFATLFPYIAFDDVHPDWDYWADFENSETLGALDFDSSEHTHPVHCTVDSDEAVEALFDEIVYNKAATIIRMIMHHIGKDELRKVLRVYFSKFENSNADTYDLISIFSEVLKVDMKPFFDAWTLKSGYPVIIVEGNHIKQAQFTKQGIREGAIWPIPLSIAAYVKGKKIDVNVILEKENLISNFLKELNILLSILKLVRFAEFGTKAQILTI